MFHVKKNSKRYDEKYFMMNLKVVQANKSLSQMAHEMHQYYNRKRYFKDAEKRRKVAPKCCFQM